jgi:hypothetical protein
MSADNLYRDLGLHIFRTELLSESNVLKRLLSAYLELIAVERYAVIEYILRMGAGILTFSVPEGGMP